MQRSSLHLQSIVFGVVAVVIVILIGSYVVDYCVGTLRAFKIQNELDKDPGLKTRVDQLVKACEFGRKQLRLSRGDIHAMYQGERRNGLGLEDLQKLYEEHESLRAKEG